MPLGTTGLPGRTDPAESGEFGTWLAWLGEQGEMGARVVAFDWGATSLGPLESWPPSLRGAVSLCMGSLFPMSVRWGADLVVIYNDACRDIYGPDRFAHALGRSTDDVWPEAAAEVSAQLRRILATGTGLFAVDRLVPINRAVTLEECYFTFSFAPIVDESGRTGGIFSAFIETTAEVLAERRMRTLARLSRELNDARTEIGVATLAMDVLAANAPDHPSAALYRSGDGAPSGPLAAFGPPADCSDAAELVEACLREGRAQHGAASDAGLHAYPVRDPEHGVATHVLLITASERRAWDESLDGYLGLAASALGAALLSQEELLTHRRRTSELTALDAAKSAFFAGVSHELRTPLALISAPVQDVIEREPGLSPASLQALHLVQANVARLARMVEAMLDFSRMEAGRLVPHLEQVDVDILVAGLASSFAPAFERAGLEFSTDIATLSRPALLDRDFFERIVSNLLTNALKFTPSGRVRLRLVAGADDYAVEVTDTGLGIEPAYHDRIFDRFERIAPRPGARSLSGAGIGLAMVRQLTGLLDGSVTVSSRLGEGSTFTVRLPLRPARPVGVAGQSVTPRPVASFLSEIDSWTERDSARRTGPRHAARLLVAEDDPELARFLTDCLSADYEVSSAADGVAALQALHDAPPDLVLTDVTMPNLSGLELVREIRSDPKLRDLPVVLLSSSGGDEATTTALKEGADDYITKPFSLLDLRSRLAANLVRARERSAEAAWRRAILSSLRDPMVVFDSLGLVVELNQSFTDLFGYTLADGPIRPPYPWWPTESEDAEGLASIRELHSRITGTEAVDSEMIFYTRDRRPIWIHSTGSSVRQPYTGLDARIRVLRDITREKQAQLRRAAAAQVSADFAHTDDLAILLKVAEHGFELLFDGNSTIQVDIVRRYLFSGGRAIEGAEVSAEVLTGLAGVRNADTVNLRPGILLVPETSTTGARAWVQFPRPRRISTDEMIAADLLAQAFGLAVDRLVAQQRAADQQANLELAMESHRLIGQAVGILVERHRLLPGQAFDRLKQASQNRNLKLRELAARVIESGAEPDRA